MLVIRHGLDLEGLSSGESEREARLGLWGLVRYELGRVWDEATHVDMFGALHGILVSTLSVFLAVAENLYVFEGGGS